jgi:hypothetical protein
MRDQRVVDFVNRLHQCVAEFLVLKMRPHSFDNALPGLIAGFIVNGIFRFLLSWRESKFAACGPKA